MNQANSERWAKRVWAKQVGDLEVDLDSFLFTLPAHHILPYTLGLLRCARDAKAKLPYLAAIFTKEDQLEAAKKYAPQGDFDVWCAVRGMLFPHDPVMTFEEMKEEDGRRYRITRDWNERKGYGKREENARIYEEQHTIYDIHVWEWESIESCGFGKHRSSNSGACC